MKYLSKIILSIFILFTLIACNNSKKVDKDKIREDLYITFTKTNITIEKNSEFLTDSIIKESNGVISLPDSIDTSVPGVYELMYTASSFDDPEIKKEYIVTVTVVAVTDNKKESSDKTKEYKITELNFGCGEEGSAVTFEEDGTVRYTKYEFSTSVKGNYKQIAENVYELQLPGHEDLKYFVYNEEELKAYFYLDNSLSLEELNSYSVVSRKTGCSMVNSNGVVVSTSYTDE